MSEPDIHLMAARLLQITAFLGDHGFFDSESTAPLVKTDHEDSKTEDHKEKAPLIEEIETQL